MLKKIMLTIAVSVCAVILATAQEIKIAVADMENLFQNYEKTKVVEMRFNQQLEVAKDYATKIYTEVKNLQRDYESLLLESQNVGISEAERENRKQKANEKYQQFQSKQRELANFNATRRKQIDQEYERLCKELVDEIKQAVSRQAVLEGIQIVLDSSKTNTGLLYHAPNIPDLTSRILENLNRQYRQDASSGSTDNAEKKDTAAVVSSDEKAQEKQDK